MENLPTITDKPQEVLDRGKRAATALMSVVNQKKKPVRIGGETYLEYEDWQLICEFDARGYTVKTHDAVFVEIDGVKGAKAKAELIDPEGRIVGGAEAYCMRDEENWTHKPWFQLASMAQTRAGAKTLRNKFSFIAPLAGVKSTPAEEMDGVNGEKPSEKQLEENDLSRIDVIITDVTKRDGKNKAGKPYTLYTIHVGNDKYTTFSESIAKDAKTAKIGGLKALIDYKNTKFGDEITSLVIEEPPEEQ